ncbi:DUF342 domain-containing protein [Cytobacillus sp. Hz8]|uniref:DUF342 domain-containing protein n=1 Tax=Cytobacillus sp. Hz8 TaxID=3347168 RepID=UPI0035D5DFCB
MEELLKIQVSKERLKAYLEVTHTTDTHTFSLDELDTFIQKQRIVFGVKREQLMNLVTQLPFIQQPVLIAEGEPSIPGQDAYLQYEIQNMKHEQKEKRNFREVLDIPSVNNGQLLASVVPPTNGKNGKDIFGRIVPAKPGRPLKIRPGKNVVLKGNQFFSTIDGQLSVTNHQISVNPVFEVNGDLDLKTGNIHFVGTVTISGDVPSGYEIIAGGDILIQGTVEGAILEAGGNITVKGGITGGNRGKVVANGDIQAAYLNQANVKAKQNIIIDSSILNSHVQATGSIFCHNGRIIGGQLSAGEEVRAKEIGNRLFAKTDLYVGYDPQLEEKEQGLQEEIRDLTENLKKLMEFEKKLSNVLKVTGKLNTEQKQIFQRQQATKSMLQANINQANEQLDEIAEEKQSKLNASVSVTDTVYPNTTIHFGKYARVIQKKHEFTKFYITNGEIQFEPLA